MVDRRAPGQRRATIGPSRRRLLTEEDLAIDRPPPTTDRAPRVNERIRIREVRVIDEHGEQLGILPTRQALEVARERGLDLVEVAPTAVPPVCRLMDYGQYRYEQGRKERDARKHQKTIETKEVRLKPKTDVHDLQTKARQARRFLDDGDRVKLTVLFRGRELAHPEIGRNLLLQLVELAGAAGLVEGTPHLEGRNMSLVLAPRRGGGGTAPAGAARPRPGAAAPPVPLPQ